MKEKAEGLRVEALSGLAEAWCSVVGRWCRLPGWSDWGSASSRRSARGMDLV